MVRKSGERFAAELTSVIYRTHDGQERTSMFVHDVSERERRERELREANERLDSALAEVHHLRGLLAICAYCKKVRTADNYWQKLEAYISAHAPVDFSHGICPSCMAEHFPQVR
jgi:PAS domain-containing protein